MGYNLDKLTERQQLVMEQIYYENKSSTETAKSLGISKQAVQQMLKRIFTKFNVTWAVFARKKNGKIIYNIPLGLQ